MNLTKKIDLYFGQSPVKGDCQEMKRHLDKETEFCAVYAESDLPADVQNKTSDHMKEQFGTLSQFARDHNGSYVRLFHFNIETGLASVSGPLDAEALKGSGYKAGGMFFNMDIAEPVLKKFERLGYEINKKYD